MGERCCSKCGRLWTTDRPCPYCRNADLERRLALAKAEDNSLDAAMALQEHANDRIADLERALRRINEIRDSIIGRQTVNWSMHIYPLVKALNDAGFEGAGYDVARRKAEDEHVRLWEPAIVLADAMLEIGNEATLDETMHAERIQEIWEAVEKIKNVDAIRWGEKHTGTRGGG